MPRWVKWAGGAILLLLAAVAAVFGAYLLMARAEHKKVSAFCAEIKPGTSVASLPALAAARGLEPSWLQNPDKAGGSLFYPLTTTMGEVSCVIRHDGAVATSAEMR